MDWNAVVLTVQLASLTTLVLLLIAPPLAAWLTITQRRWAVVVEAIVAMPLVLPPTVLGFYLLVALGPRSPVGRWWTELTGHQLTFSFTGLLIASVIYSLPFAVQPLVASFSAIDSRYVTSAVVMGHRFPTLVRRVFLPMSRAGVLTAVVLSFAHTVGEFGVVLMVGGNIPGVTRTLSITIYDDVQSLNYSSAATTSAVLLVFSLLVLVIAYTAGRRQIWRR